MTFKKWFLVQVWRLQQIGTIASLLMLALTLTLTLSNKISWRFDSPYEGPVIVFLSIVLGMWGASYVWDRKAKMWVEQTEVTVERNPYASLHLSMKEILQNQRIWIPLLEMGGRQEDADLMKAWVEHEFRRHPVLKQDVEDIRRILEDRP